MSVSVPLATTWKFHYSAIRFRCHCRCESRVVDRSSNDDFHFRKFRWRARHMSSSFSLLITSRGHTSERKRKKNLHFICFFLVFFTSFVGQDLWLNRIWLSWVSSQGTFQSVGQPSTTSWSIAVTLFTFARCCDYETYFFLQKRKRHRKALNGHCYDEWEVEFLLLLQHHCRCRRLCFVSRPYFFNEWSRMFCWISRGYLFIIIISQQYGISSVCQLPSLNDGTTHFLMRYFSAFIEFIWINHFAECYFSVSLKGTRYGWLSFMRCVECEGNVFGAVCGWENWRDNKLSPPSDLLWNWFRTYVCRSTHWQRFIIRTIDCVWTAIN